MRHVQHFTMFHLHAAVCANNFHFYGLFTALLLIQFSLCNVGVLSFSCYLFINIIANTLCEMLLCHLETRLGSFPSTRTQQNILKDLDLIR